MTDEPQPTSPMVPMWWFLASLALCVALGIIAGCQTFSVKKTQDLTSSQAVTVYSWKEIAGKAYPVTEYSSQIIHDKTSETIKSGCTVGVALSSKGTPGAYISPEVLGFGPGSFTLLGYASKDEIIGGIGYRLNF